MSNNVLNARYNTLLSFERILNTFYAISNFNLARLKKYDTEKIKEQITTLAPFIKDSKNKTNKDQNLVIVFFSNKGLCGGYNNNINKKLYELEQTVKNIQYIVIGNRGERYMQNRNVIKTISSKDTDINVHIEDIVKLSYEYKLQNIYAVYNQYINILQQDTIYHNALSTNNITTEKKNATINHTHKKFISQNIIYKCYMHTLLYCIYVSTRKSEESMRIQTTFNAKKNTKENLEILKLQINKIRKMKATTEILETTSASEALKNILI